MTARTMRAAIFDLDGVIVDTAKYHYLAWKRLARELGFDFSEADNERLKGVSRTRSLEILLEIGGIDVCEADREAMAARKNEWYVQYISDMTPDELLPGAVEYIAFLRSKGIKIAVASASKNASLILDRLQIGAAFDVVVDGTKVTKAKPDPEVFIRAAADLGVPNADCVVFEDAEAGVQAAKRAGMGCVGVGKPGNLRDAEIVITGFEPLLTLNMVPPQPAP
jgi:beta-phosphoglucomutase